MNGFGQFIASIIVLINSIIGGVLPVQSQPAPSIPSPVEQTTNDTNYPDRPIIPTVTRTIDTGTGTKIRIDPEASRELPVTPPPPVRPILNMPPMHRIATRVVSAVPEFYDTVTGETFTPRGNNYVHFAKEPDPWGGTGFDTVDFYPGLYSHDTLNTAFATMSASGYNIVRIWVSPFKVGSPTGIGLNAEYMDNFIDALHLAKQNDLYVYPTLSTMPHSGGYRPIQNPPSDIEGVNMTYLWQPYIDGIKKYQKDFYTYLKNAYAPLDAVLAWQLDNEPAFLADKMPLSLTSGKVAIANGASYDMSSAQKRQSMMDAGMAYYANQIGASMKLVDPNHMVTISFFSPVSLPSSDPRRISTVWMIRDPLKGGVAALDFIDLHVYIGTGISATDQLAGFNISQSKKPLLLGEMGIPYGASAYPTAAEAAKGMTGLQALSCDPAYRIKGWLFYTWNTTGSANGGRGHYTAQDGSGAIRDALSPTKRPDPCTGDTSTLDAKAELPHATVSISASPSSIPVGGSTKVTYSSTNATEGNCDLKGPNFTGWGGTSIGGTVVSLNLSADTTFTYLCTGPDGQMVQAQTTVTIKRPPPPPVIPTAHAPRGSFDSEYLCDSIGGWAQDQDAPLTPIKVKLWLDAPEDEGTLAGQVTADQYREDLCSVIGSCRHGFSLNLPAQFRDGQHHFLYGYAIDAAGVNSAQLSLSPMTIQCSQ